MSWLAPRLGLAAVALGLIPIAATAADRPYLLTANAAAEEDNDRSTSVETTWQRLGALRGASLAVEYSFVPTTSLQLGLAHARDRDSGDSVTQAEIEFKLLFNHIARDGWGWGVTVALDAERAGAQGWRIGNRGAALAYSLQVGGAETETLLHLNAGVAKPRGEARQWTRSTAVERNWLPRTTWFAEMGRADGATLVNLGARHWLRRDRLAFDLSLLSSRASGSERQRGFVIGLGWYDL